MILSMGDSNEKPQEPLEQKQVQFIDLFNPRQPRSDQELIEARLAICSSCEFLKKKRMQCMKCGCYMKLKSTLKQASCPVGKW